MESIKLSASARSRNLVFTSAGDHSNIHSWLKGRRDFDLWVAYYGDEPGRYQDEADTYFVAKGSKFQNFHLCYQRWRQLLAQYDAVILMDDDVLIDATGLTRLFAIRKKMDLWLLQPAFRQLGKISWDITRVRPTAKLRYTNFVEMTCPLFRMDKLAAFMDVFNGELVGYGEDWWFLRTLGAELENHVAIVDEVTCINPHDRTKGGRREIDRLTSHGERKLAWERVKAQYGLDERGRRHEEYGRVKKSAVRAAAGLIRYFPDRVYDSAKGLARRVLSPASSR